MSETPRDSNGKDKAPSGFTGRKAELKTRKNLLFSLTQMASSALSSLLLVPLLSGYFGVEGYGYVGVGNVVVGIASIVSLAITSMSTRYIFLSYEKDREEANVYFNSIFISCVAMGVVTAVMFAVISNNISNIINITAAFVPQVQGMLFFMGGSFCLSVLSAPFLSGQYYCNDLRLFYSFSSVSQLARIGAPLLLFSVFGPSLWLPYLVSFLVDLSGFVVYIWSNERFLPGIVVSPHLFSLKKVGTVLSGGIWTSVNKAGSMLISTLSSYLSNILAGVIAAGFFASFAQLQSLFATLTNAIVGAVLPTLINAYGESNESCLRLASKYLAIISAVVGTLCGVACVYALPFFTLWIGESLGATGTCAILMIAFLPFAYPLEVLSQVLILQVRVKVPALATIAFGLFNVGLAILLSGALQMGLLGIVLAQAVSQSLRGWLFFPLYTADLDRPSVRRFYRAMILGPIGLVLGALIAMGISCVLSDVWTWGGLLVSGFVSVAVCGFLALLVRRPLGSVLSRIAA